MRHVAKNGRRLFIRGYLILLVVSVLLPVLLFTGVVFARYYMSEQTRIEEDLQNDARQLALTIDRDLAGLQSTLETLATSQRLLEGDYVGFDQQARRVRQLLGVDVLARDLTGQQVANTRVALGTPLPREAIPGDEEVTRTRQSVVTDIFTGAVAQRPVFTITSPVMIDGRVVHFLNLSLLPERMADILSQSLSPGRRAGIVDRNGKVVARTEDLARAIGMAAAPDFLRAARAGEGIWHGTDVGGERVRTAFTHSKLSGWTVYVNLPEDIILSSMQRTILALVALGLALIALAVLIAYWVGGRLAGSMGTLAAQAAALGRGEQIEPRRLPVAEIDDVGRELVDAAAGLRERAAERDRAEAELRRFSGSLERMVAERTDALVSEMRKRAETEGQLHHVQKMDAIGHLTGGLAHDFNNMLAIILGNLDLARRRLAKGETGIDKFLNNALEGGRRAATLTQRLLAFARRQPLAPQPVDANKLVAGMSDLLHRSLGEMVQIETVLAAGLWRTHVDPNQLESAILNLAVNARDAMPDGGKLTIETANAYLDEDYTGQHAGVTAGQYVLVAVTDTGTGMTPEVREKAFDPFFTTKASGIGTGLGLSQVYGFVKQSGGHVKIYSEAGQGTTIKIYLPRYFGADVAAGETAERGALPQGDGATVLVVEDEAGVRRYSADALRELGYRVLEADNPGAALKLIDTEKDITLLFTDVVMPDMNGRRLSEAAIARRPELKVLFTTGYTRNAIVHNGMLDPDVNLLPKPFTLDQLARKIADVLKGQP
jgi:signal transduction histidine kinase/ActR/RegA family two-component response regulator